MEPIITKTDWYPQNFPRERTEDLLLLLARLEKIFPKLKTTADLEKQLRKELQDKQFQKQFGSKVPPLWWLRFLLLRFPDRFGTDFIGHLQPLLVKTKMRSLSGIVPLSLFTDGTGCPFNCAYCPNEPGIPKSYLSDEPAVMRAIRHNFDPFEQTLNRLIMFTLSNHPVDKVEVIVKGGTFSFYSEEYRTGFMKRVFDACNTDVIQLIATGKTEVASAPTLEEAQHINETARSRIIGINIETRPDYINRNELIFLRRLGVTHVEIGVQMPDNALYRLIRRGHTVAQVAEATKTLRDAGFKVGYHLMPNLPGSTPEKDHQLMDMVFTDSRFKPDHLKLYPTTVTVHTLLDEWYKNGSYVPYPFEKLLEVILAFKAHTAPPWVRIGRLTRDITTNAMTTRQFNPNLREIVQKEMEKRQLKCSCIRCREIRDDAPVPPVSLREISYDAAGGKEYFMEYVDANQRSLGFLRLRIPSGDNPLPGLDNAALVRELHVYGQAMPIGKHEDNKIQHMSLGKKLLRRAQTISRENGYKNMAVIAGVGTREYYRKQGFALKETYMLKYLANA